MENDEKKLIRSLAKYRDTMDLNGFVDDLKDLCQKEYTSKLSSNFLKEDIDYLNQKVQESGSIVAVLHQVHFSLVLVDLRQLSSSAVMVTWII